MIAMMAIYLPLPNLTYLYRHASPASRRDLSLTSCFWSADVVCGTTPQAPSRSARAFNTWPSSASKSSWALGNINMMRCCRGLEIRPTYI